MENHTIENQLCRIINYIENTFDVSERHVKQKPILTPEGRLIYVDPHMMPILKHLWDRGVKTIFSCSGHRKTASSGNNVDWSAYLVTERNKNFEKYVKSSIWEKSISGDRISVYSRERGKVNTKKSRDMFLKWLLEY